MSLKLAGNRAAMSCGEEMLAACEWNAMSNHAAIQLLRFNVIASMTNEYKTLNRAGRQENHTARTLIGIRHRLAHTPRHTPTHTHGYTHRDYAAVHQMCSTYTIFRNEHTQTHTQAAHLPLSLRDGDDLAGLLILLRLPAVAGDVLFPPALLHTRALTHRTSLVQLTCRWIRTCNSKQWAVGLSWRGHIQAMTGSKRQH